MATLLLTDDICKLRASVIAVVAGKVSGGSPFLVLRDLFGDEGAHELSPISERVVRSPSKGTSHATGVATVIAITKRG